MRGGGSPACHLQPGAGKQSPPPHPLCPPLELPPAHPALGQRWGAPALQGTQPQLGPGGQGMRGAKPAALTVPWTLAAPLPLGTVLSPSRDKPLSPILCLSSSWFCRSKQSKGAFPSAQPGCSVPVPGMQWGKGCTHGTWSPTLQPTPPRSPKKGTAGHSLRNINLIKI